MKTKLKGGMKMENKYILGIAIVGLIAILGVSLVSAYGFGNNISEEERTQMQTAIEKGDFQTWKNLMQSQVTEENFNKMKERHEQMGQVRELKEQLTTAIQEGDSESADSLRAQIQELMPKKGTGMGKGKGMGLGKGGFNADGSGFNGNCPMLN